MKFDNYDLDEDILKGIQDAGFKECMPVQAETLKTIGENRDVFAQSQTGTGKTAAFLISTFQLLKTDKHFKGKKALIIVPTRELVVQIEKEAKVLGKYLDFRVGTFYGGVGYQQQEEALEKGLDILIGTPGRLIDFSKSGKINFSEIGVLIIDEADRLFDMGFLPDLRNIFGKMVPATERRTMLFSATLSAKVGNLAWEYMNDPGEIVIEPEQVAVEAITQELYHVGTDEKMSLLLGLLKRESPETAIIFANTKHATYEVAKRLEANGYAAKCLMGDLPQKKRLRIVDEAKAGKVKFLVATDVAARGLHIDNLELVINYDVPTDAESYIHRIGRTARAGNTGKSITLACEKFVYGLPAIEKLLGSKIPICWADDSLMVEDVSAGMRFHFDRDRGHGRDDRRSPHKRDNKNSRYKGNKRPLDPRAAKVQSAVMAVSGSLDSVEQEYRKSKPNGKKRKPAYKPEGKKSDYKPNKTKSSRPNNKGSKPQHKKYSLERVNSSNSVEDRLAYYKAKYGEDFKADPKMKQSKPSSKKTNGPKRTNSQQKSSNKGPSKNNTTYKKTNKNNKKVQKPSNLKEPVVSKDIKKTPEKKKGFFARLFKKK